MDIQHESIGGELLIFPGFGSGLGWYIGHILQRVLVRGEGWSKLRRWLVFCFVVSLIPSSIATGWLASATEWSSSEKSYIEGVEGIELLRSCRFSRAKGQCLTIFYDTSRWVAFCRGRGGGGGVEVAGHRESKSNIAGGRDENIDMRITLHRIKGTRHNILLPGNYHVYGVAEVIRSSM